MDPNLFHLDWEQVAEVLAGVVVVAFILERALSIVFESRPFVNWAGSKGVKEPIAFGVSLLVCWYWKFDALGVIFRGERVRFLGILVTAAVIAGGSKASLKLFRDVMGIENKYAKAVREKGERPPGSEPSKPVGSDKKESDAAPATGG